MAAVRLFAFLLCLGLAAATAHAQLLPTAKADDIVTAVPSAFAGAGATPALTREVTRAFAPRWRASFGFLSDPEQTWNDIVRYDQTLAFGTSPDGATRDNWRQFLGFSYSPIDNVSLLGGIARSGGFLGKGDGFSPTGYERLRVSSGLAWTVGDWGLGGSFSFIPAGAARVPGYEGYFPSQGSTSATMLFALTVTRHF
ncbi:MAG TPA: hypothetical protein VGK20_01590 [Candidatus Binatia bacterium]